MNLKCRLVRPVEIMLNEPGAFVYTPSEGKTLTGVVATLASKVSGLRRAVDQIALEDLLLATALAQPFRFPHCSEDRRAAALQILRRETGKRLAELSAEADEFSSKVTAIEQHIRNTA